MTNPGYLGKTTDSNSGPATDGGGGGGGDGGGAAAAGASWFCVAVKVPTAMRSSRLPLDGYITWRSGAARDDDDDDDVRRLG